MHGGAAGSGAPRGNRNAWKHGRYSAAAKAAARAERQRFRAFFSQMRDGLASFREQMQLDKGERLPTSSGDAYTPSDNQERDAMPDSAQTASDGTITERITAIRDRWHTMQHPMYQALAAGELELRALGTYMAQHAQFVRYALQGFGLLYTRAPGDVRKMVVENMAEEEGLMGGHTEQGAHDHMQMIHDFCAAAGMSPDEVRDVDMTPAWWARSLYYLQACREEPVGVVLAMQFSQEGQMPALNSEIILPALEAHYGIKPTDPAALFFAEHALADIEHSGRQLTLAVKYLDTPELERRAEQVTWEKCRQRWAATTETYRAVHLGEKELLPPGAEI